MNEYGVWTTQYDSAQTAQEVSACIGAGWQEALYDFLSVPGWSVQEVNILVLVSAVAAVAHAVIDPRAGDHLGGGGGAVEQLPGARGGARLVRTVLGWKQDEDDVTTKVSLTLQSQ